MRRTGVLGLLLNDDHDALTLDDVAHCLLRATVTAQVDDPLGSVQRPAPAGNTGPQIMMPS